MPTQLGGFHISVHTTDYLVLNKIVPYSNAFAYCFFMQSQTKGHIICIITTHAASNGRDIVSARFPVQQNTLKLRIPSQRPNQTLLQSNTRRLPKNGQPRRRLEYPPGPNTRFCLNFVSITFVRKEGASWLEILQRVVEPLFFFSVFSRKLQGRGGGGIMVLSDVEAKPASSKSPAGVDARISPGERYDFGTSAPSSTRASSLDSVRAGGLAKLPKLIKLVGSSTRARVFMSGFTSASTARRGC